MKNSRHIQILTCVSFYRIAEDAGTLRVLGRDCERIHLTTLQPSNDVGRLGCRVVGTGAAIVLGVEDVADTTFRTGIPAHCDITVAAVCHCSHTGGRADN